MKKERNIEKLETTFIISKVGFVSVTFFKIKIEAIKFTIQEAIKIKKKKDTKSCSLISFTFFLFNEQKSRHRLKKKIFKKNF